MVDGVEEAADGDDATDAVAGGGGVSSGRAAPRLKRGTEKGNWKGIGILKSTCACVPGAFGCVYASVPTSSQHNECLLGGLRY